MLFECFLQLALLPPDEQAAASLLRLVNCAKINWRSSASPSRVEPFLALRITRAPCKDAEPEASQAEVPAACFQPTPAADSDAQGVASALNCCSVVASEFQLTGALRGSNLDAWNFWTSSAGGSGVLPPCRLQCTSAMSADAPSTSLAAASDARKRSYRLQFGLSTRAVDGASQDALGVSECPRPFSSLPSVRLAACSAAL